MVGFRLFEVILKSEGSESDGGEFEGVAEIAEAVEDHVFAIGLFLGFWSLVFVLGWD